MKSILVAGLAIIAVLPAIAILFLFIYKFYNDFKKRTFEKKGNIVLDRKRIGEVIKESNPSESLRIFKSAICDHSEINGLRYYTKFPFGLKIINPHDNHRKAFIAHEIGEMLAKTVFLNGDIEFCMDILINLTKSFKEKYYTQIIAWNSLGKLALLDKDVLLEKIGLDYLKTCISRDFITGTGVIKFIFNLKEHIDLDNTSINYINDIIVYSLEKASLPLLALLAFKLNKSPYFKQPQKQDYMKRLPDDPKFNSFLNHLDVLSLGFIKQELSEGLKNLGLQSLPYSQKSTEGEIVRFLIRDLLEEIYIPTSYMLHSFNHDDLRQNLTDFLWS
ncbi:MAG: hypothetical protein ACMUIU_16020 [bacterium]